MVLKRLEHAEMIVGHQRVRVSEILRQPATVLDYVTGGAFDRGGVGVVEFYAERLCRDRVRVSARAERVAPHVSVREVRLAARTGLGDQRDGPRRRYRGHFVIARSERDGAV